MSEPHTTPELQVRAHGNGWAVAVPTAVVCAVISVLGNWLMRPTHEAQAAAASPSEISAMRDDIRELRGDVKAILSRMGALEDAKNNDAVVRGARPAP